MMDGMVPEIALKLSGLDLRCSEANSSSKMDVGWMKMRMNSEFGMVMKKVFGLVLLRSAKFSDGEGLSRAS